jgi:Phage integrase SAM-like domain
MVGKTNPYDIESVSGYPHALQIYRIPASSAWQVRLFVGRKYLRKSTRCESKGDATKFAKRFYDEVKLAERLDFDIHRDSFAACANHLMKRQEALVGRGERDDRLISEDRKKLTGDILPYFGVMAVADITTQTLDDYIDHISRDRKLSPSTLNKHLVVIRKVLNEARRRGYLKALPPFPTIKRRDNPRPYFTDSDYRKLWRTASKLAKQNLKVRYVPLTDEIWDFIVFHVNVFVRVSDLKTLKHRHVQVVKENGMQYLLLSATKSKTVNRDSATMPFAVDVYERLLLRHKERGFGKADDYVFFPEYQNRAYALQTMRRQFEFILEHAGLKEDARGRARTLYSLRHTALMFRLLKGDNVDIFLLARNALTSVDQLERFCLSHVESRTRIENLQSMRAMRLS